MTHFYISVFDKEKNKQLFTNKRYEFSCHGAAADFISRRLIIENDYDNHYQIADRFEVEIKQLPRKEKFKVGTQEGLV